MLVSGLEANATYFFRVIASNAGGVLESGEGSGAFFTTLPSAAATLADGREWELVSPVEKHGATIEPISREGALIQASVGGDRIAWTASSPVSEEAQGNRRPEPVQVISARGGSGWGSVDVSTPHNKGEGVITGAATEFRFFSGDLGLAVVQPQVPGEPLENPPLAPEAREKTIYRRDDSSGLFTPLVTAGDDLAGEPFGGKLEYEGASEDARHVVFSSEVPLLVGGPADGLYEWEAGGPLKLLSTLPGSHAPASEPSLGDLGRDVRGAVSQDGSRVFWVNGAEDEGPLFMTDTQTGESVQLNAAQGMPEAGAEEVEERLDEVVFQGASVDGSRVFFTDTWPLTPDSTLEPLDREEEVSEPPAGAHSLGRPADLYEYDVETGVLSDLTPGSASVQADVLGTIAGTSSDGAVVYFVANGALAPGALPGDCPRTKPLLPHPDAGCNVYVSVLAGARRVTRLVARISDEDAPDWAGGNSPLPGDLGGLTDQVSENGRFLVFMSEQELTGYQNVDASAAAAGAHDEEVFLYDNEKHSLVCVSCGPEGGAPTGVFDTEAAGEGLGLVVDRPETWQGHWLSGSVPGWTLFALTNPTAQHQSRYLSDTGRVFFDSASALSSQLSTPGRQETIGGTPTQVGVENVYEYEPDGEGSCASAPGCVSLISSGTSAHESAFLDASASGSGAFFLTTAALSGVDSDSTFDVYDARECATQAAGACLPAPPAPASGCSGEECRGAFTALSAFSVPASFTEQGGEVLSSKTVAPPPEPKPKPKLTRAQELKRALRVCAKQRSRHKRARCRARAERRYGPEKHKHAKKSAGGGRRGR